jgi:hypothetical protein
MLEVREHSPEGTTNWHSTPSADGSWKANHDRLVGLLQGCETVTVDFGGESFEYRLANDNVQD